MVNLRVAVPARAGYRRLLDVDSFLKYLIINEVCGNIDAFWSTYMTLDRGADKFVVGPVWDFDLGFDNDQRVYPVNNLHTLVTGAGSASYAQGMRSFTERILYQDNTVWDRLKYLWSYARTYWGVDAESLTALVDEYEKELEASATLNFKRWKILGEKVHQNPKAYGSYKAEVDNVRRFVTDRPAKLDILIGLTDVTGIDERYQTLPAVEATAGTVIVSGCERYEVYTLQGVKVAYGEGSATISLPAGLYIVKADSNIRKVLL